MKKDVLEIRYEALFRIVVNRYSGVTPISIKKYLIDEVDFNFESNAKNDAEYLEKKTAYINKEVTEAIKLLSHKPKIDKEIESFPLVEDEVSEQEIEDYENYPHTLLIGIPEILQNGQKGRKNSAYRLNSNIKFSIEDEYDLLLATRHLYNLYRVDPETDINSPMITFLTKKRDTIYIDDDYENKNLTLLIDTFVQLNTHKVYMPKKQYDLQLLLILISLKADLNITVQNQKSTFNMNNVAIEELVFGMDYFNMVCDGMSIKIEDTNQIKLIESSCDNTLADNIVAVTQILDNYPPFVKEYFEKKIDHFKGVHEFFFQDLE